MPAARPEKLPETLSGHAVEIAQRYGLGTPRSFTGPHARGFQAEVWKLQGDTGTWAVKRSCSPIDEMDLVLGAEFQEAARSAGLAAQSSAERTLNEGRVAEFIDKPLSRRLFDQILRAVEI